MAIDDNKDYVLTGAQVKDLANQVKARAYDRNLIGATSGSAGAAGLAPAPAAGDQTKFLRGDGTWAAAGGGSSLPTIYMTDEGGLFAGTMFYNMVFPNNGFAFSASPIDLDDPGGAAPMTVADFEALFASGYPVLIEGMLVQENMEVGHGIITCYADDFSGKPKFRMEYLGRYQYYAGTASVGQEDPANSGVRWSWSQ